MTKLAMTAMNKEMTVVPLARAIRNARARGVTVAQIATITEAVELGGLDVYIDALNEAEKQAASSGIPVRTVMAMILRSKRVLRRTELSGVVN